MLRVLRLMLLVAFASCGASQDPVIAPVSATRAAWSVPKTVAPPSRRHSASGADDFAMQCRQASPAWLDGEPFVSHGPPDVVVFCDRGYQVTVPNGWLFTVKHGPKNDVPFDLLLSNELMGTDVYLVSLWDSDEHDVDFEIALKTQKKVLKKEGYGSTELFYDTSYVGYTIEFMSIMPVSDAVFVSYNVGLRSNRVPEPVFLVSGFAMREAEGFVRAAVHETISNIRPVSGECE